VTSPTVGLPETAARERYIVLDDDDRIVHVSSALHRDLGHWVGQVLWDHLPRAREVYGRSLDDARATGHAVEDVVFYAGRLLQLRAVPGADGLAVHVAPLAELDVTSLGTLMRSLEQIEAALADREFERRDRRALASLQALP
jgi:hypothetical protein